MVEAKMVAIELDVDDDENEFGIDEGRWPERCLVPFTANHLVPYLMLYLPSVPASAVRLNKFDVFPIAPTFWLSLRPAWHYLRLLPSRSRPSLNWHAHGKPEHYYR